MAILTYVSMSQMEIVAPVDRGCDVLAANVTIKLLHKKLLIFEE
jgi:hypothetical protein